MNAFPKSIIIGEWFIYERCEENTPYSSGQLEGMSSKEILDTKNEEAGFPGGHYNVTYFMVCSLVCQILWLNVLGLIYVTLFGSHNNFTG